MTAENNQDESLLDREARFWDEQEEAIDELYAKPHDWRFIPEIADYVIKPKVKALMRIIGQHREKINSLLDIGCGNGWFCHSCAEYGIRAYGVDLSPKKIETAAEEANRRGVGELCHFQASDIMKLELPEKVDLLTAHGSLHHLPDLEEKLPILIDRFLKPGGLMLFVEPHHEGMSPGIQKIVFSCANSKIMGNWFDKEHYVRVRGEDGSGPPAAAPEASAPTAEEQDGETPMVAQSDFNLRSESPAGLEFLGEEPDMGAIVKRDYDLIEEKFFHYMSGHLTNAFYTYMKPAWVRGLWRLMLPFTVWLDDRLCRSEKYSQYAEEGLWLLKRRGE